MTLEELRQRCRQDADFAKQFAKHSPHKLEQLFPDREERERLFGKGK